MESLDAVTHADGTGPLPWHRVRMHAWIFTEMQQNIIQKGYYLVIHFVLVAGCIIFFVVVADSPGLSSAYVENLLHANDTWDPLPSRHNKAFIFYFLFCLH